MSVLAFIPTSSPKSALSNFSPLRLKGSTTQHTSYTIAQRSARHPFNSALQSSSDSNHTPKQQKSINNKTKKLKKRRMSISKQSLTTAQKSNTPTTLTNTESEQRAYNELLPKTGYSLADSLEQSADNKELFETILTPIGGVYSAAEKRDEEEFEYDVDGFPIGVKQTVDNREDEEEGHDGIARIDTISNYGGREPVRWIVSLDDMNNVNSDNNDDATTTTAKSSSHVMIDLPPYSDKLATEIRQFMNPNNDTQTTGTLDAILLTNQQCIHYDNTPGVYVTRKSDLTKWKTAFPEAKVVMYRLDIPRECREEVTQVLDGYGPWGWNENGREFVETGRPLTVEEWDEETKSRVLKGGELPPEDEGLFNDGEESDDEEEEDSMYSQEAIRQREEQHRLLALYTPGHTFGSVTYVFPKRNICCSGFALPLESSSSIMDDDFDDDDDDDDNDGSIGRGTPPPIGPRLDYQGYLATSASRPRQMSSALTLINRYIDRFQVVLPARGDIVFLDSNEDTRKRELLESVGLYRKMSDIYGRLGIVD